MKCEEIKCISSEKLPRERSRVLPIFNVFEQETFEIQVEFLHLSVGYSENEEFVAPLALPAGVLSQLDLEYWFRGVITGTLVQGCHGKLPGRVAIPSERQWICWHGCRKDGVGL